MIIRSIIIDDEPLARKRIRNLLKNEADIDVIAEARNGIEAVSVIENKNPDLIFLDIQMPELDGFGVLNNIDLSDNTPQIIFVTAFDHYAISAFEVCAVDYLLKPFDRERFFKALNRARNQIRLVNNENSNSNKVNELLQKITYDNNYTARLMVKSNGCITFLKTDEIQWIEAAGNYVSLHTGKEEFLMRETMNNMEEKLDPNIFIRSHRTTIVNIEYIDKIQPGPGSEQLIKMKNGQLLTISRKYREKLNYMF